MTLVHSFFPFHFFVTSKGPKDKDSWSEEGRELGEKIQQASWVVCVCMNGRQGVQTQLDPYSFLQLLTFQKIPLKVENLCLYY